MDNNSYPNGNYNIYFIQNNTGNFLYAIGEQHLTDLIQRVFTSYILPVQVGTGIVGNIISLFVFNKQRLGQFSVGFYLFVYCLVSLFLCTLFGYTWICSLLKTNEIDTYNNTFCKLWHLVFRILLHSGAWNIVVAALDRFIMMFYPERAVDICQVFISKVVTTIIFIGMIVINIHTLWTFEVLHMRCQMYRSDLFTFIWIWMSATCNTYTPSIILIILFGLLLFGICRARPSMRSSSLRNTEPRDLTALVILLSFLYLIFTLPSTVLDIIPKVVPRQYLHQPIFTQRMYLYTYIFNVFIPLPSIIVFPASVIMSPTFRHELKTCCSSTARRMSRTQANSELKTTDSGTSDVLVVHSQSNDTLL